MSLKKFQNYEEIKNQTNQIRGFFLEDKDLDLFWIEGQSSDFVIEGKPYVSDEYGSVNENTIEFSVYDMEGNQLFWEVLPPPYTSWNQYSPSKIILNPGYDLRRNSFVRGQYRILYEFFRNSLGSYFGDRLYIESISPTRKEVRLLPVKTNDSQIGFHRDFFNFSNNGASKQQFKNYFKSELNKYSPEQITQDVVLQKIANDKWESLKSVTYNYLTSAIEKYPKDVLLIEDQTIIIQSILELTFMDVYGEGFDQQANYIYLFQNYSRFVNTLTTIDDYSGNIDYYLNFGNSENYIITNWITDDIEYPDYPHSIVLKLYKPLPQSVKEKQQVWISKQISLPIVEKVILHGLEVEPEETGYYLKYPNFNVSTMGLTGRDTGFETWDNLISTYPSTSQDILNKYISSSIVEGDIGININYSDYSDFIFFGSAEERLKNFKYKMELMDSYNESIKKASTYSAGTKDSPFVSQSIENFRTKIKQIQNSFDNYEKHLYYTSGSQYSSSIDGETLFNSINEWPKKNTLYPYSLYEITSSVAVAWYNDQISIAQKYDRENIHSFVNNVPVYLQDSDNEDYLTFLYMIGQHFDSVYSYIKHLTNTANRDESIYNGLAKDLTYNVAKSFGFDLYNGNDSAELWKWALGYSDASITGSYNSESISGNFTPYEDVSKEIWRRILNNLPYLLKTKGTERSIKALLSCYGIPTSILSIREFGGPDPRDFTDIERKSAYIFEDFVYSIDMYGSQSVSFGWSNLTGSKKPDTVEFRFASAPTTTVASSSFGYSRGDAKPTQSLVSTTTWAINLLNSGSGYGFIEFIILDGAAKNSIKTDKYRYYDNEFNSVMLTYSGSAFKLWTKKAESDRIIYYSTNSISSTAGILSSWNSNSTLYIGGSAANTWGQQFTGSIQEFKLYQTALSESTFNNHVRWPKSYNSNSPSRTYYDLVLRYSFDEPKNHSTSTTVSDVKSNQAFTTAGTANNFPSKINYTPRTEEYATYTPQVGGIYVNNKIRLEDNEVYYGDLDVEKRVEKSAYDRASVDSPKLGIYFSPVDSINRDIIATYAGMDLLSQIGDPRDRYEDKFRDLYELNNFYWKKYTRRPTYNDFIRMIKYYDQSFFNHLKSLLPARSKPVIGILLEPHILQRDKYQWKEMSKERVDYFSEMNITNAVTHSCDYLTYFTTINGLMYNSSSDCTIYSTEIDLGEYFRTESVYESYEQGVIDMIPPIQDSCNLRIVYNTISSSYDSNVGTTFYHLQYYTASNGSVVPSKYFVVQDLKPNDWWIQYQNLHSDIWYKGTISNIYNTVDGNEPVEITYTNPNKLKTTNIGPSKIRVE